MVLVDTSVWVSHFRVGESHFQTLLNRTEVLTHPFIVGELACGHLKARKEILSLLSALPSVPVVDHPEILHFIERRHLMGRGIGFVDVHLLASAQLAGVSLWTSDGRLKRAASGLKLSY